MHEVCPDPDHILDPEMRSGLTWGLMGISIITDLRVFFSETYSPIDFKLGMELPCGETFLV